MFDYVLLASFQSLSDVLNVDGEIGNKKTVPLLIFIEVHLILVTAY